MSSEFIDYVDSRAHFHTSCRVHLKASTRRLEQSSSSPHIVWLPVGYHPLLYGSGGLKHALATVNRNSFLHSIICAIFGQDGVRVQVAWKAMARSFHRMLIEW